MLGVAFASGTLVLTDPHGRTSTELFRVTSSDVDVAARTASSGGLTGPVHPRATVAAATCPADLLDLRGRPAQPRDCTGTAPTNDSSPTTTAPRSVSTCSYWRPWCPHSRRSPAGR